MFSSRQNQLSVEEHLVNAFIVAISGSCLNSVRTAFLVFALFNFTGCSSHRVTSDILPSGLSELRATTVKGPIELKLKSDLNRVDAVEYRHQSASRAFEDGAIRQEKAEQVDFTALATTEKAEPDRITQIVRVTHKDGSIDLHDFAMPELGEQLKITSTSNGRILKAGDWPENSIFYVSPISLPETKVEVGDTWTMKASWLSLGEMVPYELDMVSILKGFVECGGDTCADIEVSGNVAMQGALQQALVFRSEWRGRLLFAIDQGTVVWSRSEQ